jgi:hypothetical protein
MKLLSCTNAGKDEYLPLKTSYLEGVEGFENTYFVTITSPHNSFLVFIPVGIRYKNNILFYSKVSNGTAYHRDVYVGDVKFGKFYRHLNFGEEEGFDASHGREFLVKFLRDFIEHEKASEVIE